MAAFIYHGTNNPTAYLEFEVNPNNVTYQAIVSNPLKVRASGAPFDHFFCDRSGYRWILGVHYLG